MSQLAASTAPRTRSATARTRGVEVAGAADEGAQLDQLVEDPVAPVDLLEQRGVLERVGRHLPQPADEVQVLGEVARLVVGQLDDAEHASV